MSKSIGKQLRTVLRRSGGRLHILCGHSHSHSPGIYESDNMTCYIAKALYGMPSLYKTFDLKHKMWYTPLSVL